MSHKERMELCKKIEAHRGRPLVIYATNKRPGAVGNMATDVLPFWADQLMTVPSDAKAIDLMIAGFGGDPMVSWRIMSSIRERIDNVAVLVPQTAYSAATLLALGANEIIMHPNANLGPIDMQITTTQVGPGGESIQRQFSTEDVEAFLDFVRERLGVSDQEHLRRLFEMICKEVGTLGVGFTARSVKLATALGEKLLAMHMTGAENATRRKTLVETLSTQFHSHAYPVSRKEAMEVGLPISRERDEELESLIWQLWLDLEEEFQERRPFNPMTELLGRADTSTAKTLLSPVPQWNLPLNLPINNVLQTTASELEKLFTGKDGRTKVDPVAFTIVNAIMESSRLSHRFVSHGHILASRLPDLNIQFKCHTTSACWTKSE